MLVKIKKSMSSLDCWKYSEKENDYKLLFCVKRNNDDKVFLCFDKIMFNNKIFYKLLFNDRVIITKSTEIEEI